MDGDCSAAGLSPLPTPSQNSTAGTELSHEPETHPSLGCWVWGYSCIGSFVLPWGWQGQECSPWSWLVGNDLRQGSAKPHLLHNRAEGIPQRQAAPRHLGCGTGPPHHHLLLRRCSRLTHTLVVWEMRYLGRQVSQASQSSSLGLSTRRLLLFGEVANPWCNLSNDNTGGGNSL